MKPSSALLILLAFLFLYTLDTTLFETSAESSATSAMTEQSAFEKSEAAYRANNLGVALLEQYKARDAVESFTRALEIKPDLLIARINLSIALYYLPDADGAKREAEKSLIQDSKRPHPHYILGLIARAQNRFEAAISEFQKVLQTDPEDVGSNINVGQIFAQQKNYVAAIAAFRKAIAAEPYNETALYNLGILLTRTGHKEEGFRSLSKSAPARRSEQIILRGDTTRKLSLRRESNRNLSIITLQTFCSPMPPKSFCRKIQERRPSRAKALLVSSLRRWKPTLDQRQSYSLTMTGTVIWTSSMPHPHKDCCEMTAENLPM